MKLILKENPDQELTVTVEYPKKSSQVTRIIQRIRAEEKYLVGNENGRCYKVMVPEILYVESVDKRSFVYTKEMVYKSEKRLYQLEEDLREYDFVKASRTCLVNMNELECIKALANSRLEAVLTNGEKIIVSRTYLPEIKKRISDNRGV